MSNLADHEAEQAAITARYEAMQEKRKTKNIEVWHCYWYGKDDTIVMLAETNAALETNVRQAIAAGWYPDEDGPLPEDFGDLLEKYEEVTCGACYFGDWGYTVIDAALCDPAEEKD